MLQKRGSILIVCLIILSTLTVYGAVLISVVHERSLNVSVQVERLQAIYLAEAALAKAINEIKSLSDKGIDIRYADKGIRNSKLYSLACKEGKAILSFDKDFLNTSLFPPAKLPAVLIIHVHPPSTSKYESLFLQWLNKFSDESIGNTWILAEDGIRIID